MSQVVTVVRLKLKICVDVCGADTSQITYYIQNEYADPVHKALTLLKEQYPFAEVENIYTTSKTLFTKEVKETNVNKESYKDYFRTSRVY